MDHLTSRAQRLLDEFEKGKSVRHGIANVLMHLVHAWSDPESWYGVPASILEQLADDLTAPTVHARPLAGDQAAVNRVLRELKIIDEHGQLRPPYRPEDLNDD